MSRPLAVGIVEAIRAEITLMGSDDVSVTGGAKRSISGEAVLAKSVAPEPRLPRRAICVGFDQHREEHPCAHSSPSRR